MTHKAIEVVELSKRYFIGALNQQPTTLQGQLLNTVTAPIRRLGGLLRGDAYAASDLQQEFWALKNINFSIDEGEVVGIIGHNGAGKSTLLKVLSRITEPTEGYAKVRGRVGSLLEVGTGFHPELTGRENVFLNGSILGMKEKEVRSKFDEIVSFCEVEQFIDTPTKHYSSGMRVRLAFSVAAHLNPEVMFVDEVLSVGDAGFRKKCADKIAGVVRSGATVVVVSHNAQAITSLCERVIWLSNGQMVEDGPAAPTVAAYLSDTIKLSGELVWDVDDRPGGEIARVCATRICNQQGETDNNIDVREPFCVETDIEVLKPSGIVLKHDVFNGEGTPVFSAIDTQNPIWKNKIWEPGHYRLRMWVPGNFLQVDTYPISLVLWAWEPKQEMQWGENNVLCAHITDSGRGPTAKADFTGVLLGSVRPILDWEMEPMGKTASLLTQS